MGRRFLWVLLSVACGGEVAGGNPPPGSPSDGGATCTTSSQCSAGQVCGFPESDKCSAAGHCFATGPVCNLFQPGCSCAGQTVNVACNGLPSGYATAPVAEVGFPCASEGGPPPPAQYPCGTTDCNSGQQICYQDTTCVPSNGCTTCACAQLQFQCVSTCKQVNQAIYVQCQ